MTEVLIYATEEQADNDLERTFNRNNEVIGELERRFGDLSDVNKWKEVGEEFELDCVLRLEKIAGKYIYGGGVRIEVEHPSLRLYSNLDELVKGIRETFTTGGAFFGMYGVYGINVNEVFYTISGEYKLPEYGREEMKKELTDALALAENDSEKEFVKIFIKAIEQPDQYKLEGLSPSEIEEFVRLYDLV